ncbi:MAG: putative minor head protein [Prokaryotic dsDNA virus sp.]|jgi:hypothetical protein|nr:MAG: putative minor head protein [Prokaryotic dsDNA virus sp.]|tara:strand:- start:39471 stop:40484 length:1014 start_codon:yes stop_codon:yes gene_type:complete
MPTNINLDKILDHQVRLSRLETQGYQAHIAPSLAQTLRDIRRLLAETDSITSQRQLRSLEAEIRRVIRGQEGWAALQSDLDSLADYDNRFFAELIGGAAATSERVKRLADNSMMVLRSGDKFNSGLWPDFVQANQESQMRAVSNVLRTAYAQGLTAREMRREVSRRFDSEIARNAETLARTATNHYSTIGRRAFAAANPDVVTREVPLTVFDSRQTKICASIAARYGQEGWPVGQSPIGYPSYHFSCRTQIIPMADGQRLVGTRAARGDSGKTTQIQAGTEIDQFARRQSNEWQDDWLGPERAQLFREGKLSIRNLTDASLRPLTLQEIARREGIDL